MLGRMIPGKDLFCSHSGQRPFLPSVHTGGAALSHALCLSPWSPSSHPSFCLRLFILQNGTRYCFTETFYDFFSRGHALTHPLSLDRGLSLSHHMPQLQITYPLTDLLTYLFSLSLPGFQLPKGRHVCVVPQRACVIQPNP